MIARRRFVNALAATVLAPPLGAFAQPRGRLWRIGFLGSETPAGWARELDAFREGLKDLGYIEGTNFVLVYRWAEGAYERLPQLATALLLDKPDVLVTYGVQGVSAAQRATSVAPIVIATMAGDPVSWGFVKSLARPGGNITGLVSLSAMLTVKQLELVRDAFPGARKVALMGSLTSPAPDGGVMKGIKSVEAKFKFDVQLVRAKDANDFEAAIAALAERGVDALVVTTAPLVIAHYARIATLAARQRIPTLGNVNFAESGGLMGYGANLLHNYRRAAYFVDRIFKGVKPADLPIEQPTKIELVVNQKTARVLGIRISDVVMARADRVIE